MNVETLKKTKSFIVFVVLFLLLISRVNADTTDIYVSSDYNKDINRVILTVSYSIYNSSFEETSSKQIMFYFIKEDKLGSIWNKICNEIFSVSDEENTRYNIKTFCFEWKEAWKGKKVLNNRTIYELKVEDTDKWKWFMELFNMSYK